MIQEIEDRVVNKEGGNVKENPRLALSEIIYKKKMLEYANKLTPDTRVGYKKQKLWNSLLNYEMSIINTLQPQFFEQINDGDNPDLPVGIINRCFNSNSVEDIFEKLSMETDPWSQKILADLKLKSPISLKITLRVIREAGKSEWSECFERDFRVASRRIRDEEFQKSLEENIMGNFN